MSDVALLGIDCIADMRDAALLLCPKKSETAYDEAYETRFKRTVDSDKAETEGDKCVTIIIKKITF
jgi:hypothetical protein